MNTVHATYTQFSYNHESKLIEGYDEITLEQIRAEIKNKVPVVLKNVFPREQMLEIRRACFTYMENNESSNVDVKPHAPNYYRRDNNPEKSAVKRVKQFYASFYWNDGISHEADFMKSMTILRNKLAGLPELFTVDGVEDDGYMTYSNITHYPSGGGRLNKHQDPPNKQFAVIISSLSEKGADFHEGGFYVEYDGVKHNLDEFLEIGDVYLMQPQTVHGVDTIDPDAEEPQWEKPNGRWILFPALIEVKTLHGVKVKGLRDLES